MSKLIKAYEGAVALLTSLSTTVDFNEVLLPEKDGAFLYDDFTAADGREVVLLGQRANLGTLSEATLSVLETDILGAFTRSAEGVKLGRGFQYIDEPHWIPRSDSVTGSPPESTILNSTLLLETPDFLLISPIEVFGFLVPEPQKSKHNEFLRPAFEVISGSELVSRSWLVKDDEENRLFTTGYAFSPESLRKNPYPYGPGAFDLATKTFEFVLLPDQTTEVRMLALFFPTPQDRFGKILGSLLKAIGFAKFAFTTHAIIHFEAVRRAVAFLE